MVRHRRVGLLALVCCALLGCSKDKPVARELAERSKSAAQPAKAPVASIYDAQGRLKPGSERVEWLEIPAAFKRSAQSYGRHVLFEAPSVPLEKARDFFGARMFTGTIEEGAQRVFYKAVMPLSADGRAVRLNLQLTERAFDHTLLLDIERLSYEGAKPLSVDEARKALSREQARAE
jgi:hypothetical protein